MTKRHFIRLADYVVKGNFYLAQPFTPEQIEYLADFCHEQNGNFYRARWIGYIKGENDAKGKVYFDAYGANGSRQEGA